MVDTKSTRSDGFDQPHDLSDVEVAFAAAGRVHALMPTWEDIPENFRHHRGDTESKPWVDLQVAWFYGGLSRAIVRPLDGVDESKAWRHLSAIQHSFEPTHEHKQAAVAWLASRWFEFTGVEA
jgi:hypothetical protein